MTRRSLAGLVLSGAVAVAAVLPLHAHGDLHDQIRRATRAIQAAPASPALWLARGELHRAHREPQRALADYAEALRLDPGLEAVWLARGRLHLEAGDPAAARRDLDRFLALKPVHAPAHVLRARAQTALGDIPAAVRDYDVALATSVTPDLALDRARLLQRLGTPAALRDALEGLDAAGRRIGPVVTLELQALGIERELGDVDAALARLARLQATVPRADDWQVQRGELLLAAGQREAAAGAFRAAAVALEHVPPHRRRTTLVENLRRAADRGLRSAAR